MAIGARRRLTPCATLTASTPVLNTTVHCAWSALAAGFRLSAYILQRSTNGTTWTQIYSGTALSFDDTGRALSTTYQYRVRIKDAQGNFSTYTNTTFTTANPASRRTFLNHITALLEQAGSHAPGGGVPASAKATGVTSYLARYNFGELDNGDGSYSGVNYVGGTYNFTRFDKDLSQCAALSLGLYAMIVQRTFDGTTDTTGGNPPTNPMPSDLLSFADIFQTNASGSLHTGYQGYRWAPKVKDRIQKLAAQIGARADSNKWFAGVCTQETATSNIAGGTSVVYTAGDYTGSDKYGATAYQQALLAEDTDINNANPSSRHLWFMNFLSGVGADRLFLGPVAVQVRNNGGIVAGPDLVTDKAGGGIPSNCYPVYFDIHAGVGHSANGTQGLVSAGYTACSIQNGEWTGAGAGDPNASMFDLYNYGTASNTYVDPPSKGARDHRVGQPFASVIGHLDAFIVDHHLAPGGGSLTYQDWLVIAAAHPVVGDGTVPVY